MPSTTQTTAIESTVYAALENFGAKADEITREATWDDIDVDSLDLAELAQVVEDEHGVKMEDEDMKQIKTVGDAIDYIAAKKEAA
jgi:acyl carrier protein